MRIACLLLQVFVPPQWRWTGQAGLAGMQTAHLFRPVQLPDAAFVGYVAEKLRHPRLIVPQRRLHIPQSEVCSIRCYVNHTAAIGR